MAITSFTKFQDGNRLINGTKLNRIFQGNEYVQNLAISGTLAVTGAMTQTGVLTVTANIVANGYVDFSTATGLTAAGTTRTDALALTKAINNVTTAAASTGVVLPSAATVGVGGSVIVFNNGASAIKVYAPGSDTIDGTAGSTGVTLTNALRCQYFVTAAATWISAKLGATST